MSEAAPAIEQPLITRYRPERWNQIVGHTEMVAALSRALKERSHPHAYLLTGPSGIGKAQPYDAPVLTPTGWTLMGDLKVGSQVISPDGTPTDVTGIFEQGIQPVFKLSLSGDSSVTATADHLWQVECKSHGGIVQRLVTTKDLAESLMAPTGGARYAIANTAPIQFVAQDVPLDPYVYGWILGDGHLRGAGCGITTDIRDAEENFSRLSARLPDLKLAPHTDSTMRMYARKRHVEWIGAALSRDKHIDRRYMYNSIGIRRDVLRGLMDTDGSVKCIDGTRCKLSYHTTSHMLAANVKELVEGLGGIASIKQFSRGDIRVQIRVPFNPFYRTRKAALWRPSIFHFRRHIRKIEYIGEAECRCIKVAHSSEMYVANDCIPTHNTTIARIIAHYLKAEVVEIDAATNSGVDAMRQLVEIGEYMPFGGGKRMILIDECHALSRAAWNAILKLLEEPPPHLYLALCTTEEGKVPDTIHTRCFHVVLKPVRNREIEDLLIFVCDKEGWKVEDEVLDAVIEASTGQPRKALKILQSVHDAPSREEVARILSLIDDKELIAELGNALLNSAKWIHVRPIVLKLQDEDFEQLKIGLCRYLGGALLKTENSERAAYIWRMMDVLIAPTSTFDPKTSFNAAIGRIIWG